MSNFVLTYKDWPCPQCGFVLEHCRLVWGEQMACPNCGGSSLVTWSEPLLFGGRDDWKKKLNAEVDKKMGLKLREEAKNRSRRPKYVRGGIA